MANWSREMVPWYQFVPYQIVPYCQVWLYIKKEHYSNFCTFKMASILIVPEHYLKKHGIWSTYCKLWSELCLNYKMKRLLREKTQIFWIKEYFLLICDLILVDIPKLKFSLFILINSLFPKCSKHHNAFLLFFWILVTKVN